MKVKKIETDVKRNRIYEHYRGNRYLVVDIAKDANRDDDQFCVIYRALYDHGQLYSISLEKFTSLTADNQPRYRLVEVEEENRNPEHEYPTVTM